MWRQAEGWVQNRGGCLMEREGGGERGMEREGGEEKVEEGWRRE